MYRLLMLLPFIAALPACDRFSDVLLEAEPAAVATSIAFPDSISGESVYLLDGAWTDQSGAPASLRTFLGRPVVLTFVYTHCGAVCPMLVHEMKQIAQGLDPDVRPEVAYVLITLDPDRDTTEQLQKFAKAHGLAQPAWTLLRGSREEIRALAASVSVGYRPESGGQIAHASILTILDTRGEVVGQVPGSGRTDAAIQMLDSLLTTPTVR